MPEPAVPHARPSVPAAPLPSPLGGGEIGGVDHIAVAVADLEAAKRLYGERLGLRLLHEEEVPSEGVRVAAFDGGGIRIELLEGLDPAGAVARFVAKRGDGVHHICYGVEDIGLTLRKLAERGLTPLGEAPRAGAAGCRVAFFHPRDCGGVLVELSQRPSGAEHV